MLNVIVKREDGDDHKGDLISATALKGCPRKLKLERTRDYYAEPPKLYYATRGALYHAFLEADFPEVTCEKRIFKWVRKGQYAPWLVSGRIDYYDHSTKTIEDFKTMSDKGKYIIFKEGVKQDHIWQLNIYRWLMHGGNLGAPDGPQIFWPVRDLVIHNVFMNGVISSGRRITEVEMVSDAEARKNAWRSPTQKRYAREVEGSRKLVGQTTYGKRYQFDIDVPKVPIYHYDTVELHIAEQGPEVLRGMMEPHHMPDGVRNSAADKWQCDYCQVKDECDEVEKAIAVVNAMKKDGFGNVIM